MKIILPWLYEFGGELLKAVPGVQLRKYSGPRVIAVVEEGKECLYPEIEKHIIPPVDRKTIRSIRDNWVYDELRAKWPNDQFIMPYNFQPNIKGYFIPQVPNLKFKADVVIFPRKKSGAANWSKQAWQLIVAALNSKGHGVFAAGIESQSWHLEDCLNAWEWNNPLESSIYAIQNSLVRIGPITGLQVLSLICAKRPLLLTGPNFEKGVDTREKPNLDYLRVSDHKQVGFTQVPFMHAPPHVAGVIFYEIKKNSATS